MLRNLFKENRSDSKSQNELHQIVILNTKQKFKRPYLRTMRIFKTITFITLALLVGQACSQESKTEAVSETEHAGKAKFDAYCSSCHNNSAAVAPPAFALQKRYKMEHKTESDFADAIAGFVLNPTTEAALMKNAVNKFGLMPAMGYPKEDLTLIAQYIYHASFEKPDHKIQNDRPENEDIAQGKEIVKNTKQLLGKNLMRNLKTRGTVGALAFCNTKAIPLTDSMVNKYHTFIQRVSDKPRKPSNHADTEEIALINLYKQNIVDGVALKPTLKEKDGKKWFYKPIVTNQMCLQCHGEKDNIKPEVTKAILELYPEDAATGYVENQVRGMFKVEIQD